MPLPMFFFIQPIIHKENKNLQVSHSIPLCCALTLLLKLCIFSTEIIIVQRVGRLSKFKIKEACETQLGFVHLFSYLGIVSREFRFKTITKPFKIFCIFYAWHHTFLCFVSQILFDIHLFYYCLITTCSAKQILFSKMEILKGYHPYQFKI